MRRIWFAILVTFVLLISACTQPRTDVVEIIETATPEPGLFPTATPAPPTATLVPLPAVTNTLVPSPTPNPNITPDAESGEGQPANPIRGAGGGAATPIPPSDGESTDTDQDSEPPVDPDREVSERNPPDMVQFQNQVGSSIIARDYETMQSYMGSSFELNVWQGSGTSLSPGDAIDRLSNDIIPALGEINYVLNDIVVQNAISANPFEFFPNAAGFFLVEGLVPSNSGEGIIFIGQNADGTLYWQGLLHAPAGF